MFSHLTIYLSYFCKYPLCGYATLDYLQSIREHHLSEHLKVAETSFQYFSRLRV